VIASVPPAVGSVVLAVDPDDDGVVDADAASSVSSPPPHAASRADAPITVKPIIPRRRRASRLLMSPREWSSATSSAR
jgi:hypothetical protein